jgi:hypothetical protein
MPRTAARKNGRSAGRFFDSLSWGGSGASVLMARKNCFLANRRAGGYVIYLLTLQARAIPWPIPVNRRIMLLRHGAPKAFDMAQRCHRAVAWSGQVKRGDAHLFDVAAGCAFVIGIVMEKLEMLLTAWMRCARALGRGRGLAIKPSPRITTSASKTHCTLPLFILISFCDPPNA